jgi:hypothetical protein
MKTVDLPEEDDTPLLNNTLHREYSISNTNAPMGGDIM